MNDRYLYRAKRIDNGEWVGGPLIWNNEYCSSYKAIIIPVMHNNIYTKYGHLALMNWCAVDPLTICQCTGLKKFYEKDIVKRIDIHKVGDPSIGIIEYDVENTAFVIHWIDKQKYSPMYPWKDKIEVIGNIFDNPELLEVGK